MGFAPRRGRLSWTTCGRCGGPRPRRQHSTFRPSPVLDTSLLRPQSISPCSQESLLRMRRYPQWKRPPARREHRKTRPRAEESSSGCDSASEGARGTAGSLLMSAQSARSHSLNRLHPKSPGTPRSLPLNPRSSIPRSDRGVGGSGGLRPDRRLQTLGGPHMNISGRTRYFVAVACFALLAAACGKATESTAPASTASATPSLTGTANIFAAASLTSAFNKIIADFTAQHPGVKLTPNYNGSDTLVTQIRQGAPADVFASADTTNMDKLTSAGLVATSTVHIFAKNKLQIIVAKANPKGIKTLADLAKPGVAVVLENPSVPAGKYAAQAMATAGVTVTAKSLETSVTAVAQKVALGEADAGIVYVTDVAAAVAQHEPVEGVDIPTPPNVVATYPIGIVKAAPNPALATAFEDYVLSPPGQADLTSFGLLPPS